MIDLTQYRRRATHEVRIGACTIGGTHPVAVQSMTNTDTRDTAACVAQIERIARAGAPIVRLTAQGGARSREPARHHRAAACRREYDGPRGRHPFPARSGGRGGAVRRQGTHQPGQLPPRPRRTGSARRPLPRAGRRAAHRRQPRLALEAHLRRVGRHARRGWWPQPWSFCTSAAARRSTKWSSR